MPNSTHIVDFSARAQVHSLTRDLWLVVHDNAAMADTENRNHLKAWRKFRQMTQQQLADAVVPPTTKQVIQALESGARGLSDKWLRRLAPALHTRPGLLLDHDPNALPTNVLDIWADVPDDRKAEAEEMLRIFTRHGGAKAG
jgi:transcriptional regulator with XRE-family HTH domain